MESRTLFLPNGMEAVEAKYTTMGIEEYDENPYIQALPALCNKTEIIKNLINIPQYKQEECHLDSAIRMHLIHRLYKFYQPLPTHIKIWNMIDSLIRQGYLARNPFDKNYRNFLHESGKSIINRNFEIATKNNFRTTSSTGTIIGFSGMGKTTTVNRVLSNIPQIIIHNEYRGYEFSQIQLTWLKLEAPHNASLKALSLQYFMKLDELLGTNNFNKYVTRNLSLDAMLPLMGQAGQNVGLGLLVIDELQHLIGSNVNKIMNYFVTLINSFGIPVLFIGTPGAYPVFENELRIARRITGNGEVIWNNMSNDGEFGLFMEGMWKYQWLKEYMPLTRELIDVFYEETQGITDLVVKLFVNIQAQSIELGKESITIALVKSVAKESFRAMKGMLDAIKSKNPYKIAKYDDIRTLEIKDENMVKSISSGENKKVSGKTLTTNQMIEVTEQKKNNVTKSKEDKSYDIKDVRYIVSKAKTNNISVYQALVDENYIDNMKIWE